MFTGIIEELGVVERSGARLKIECSRVLEDSREGSSIASAAQSARLASSW